MNNTKIQLPKKSKESYLELVGDIDKLKNYPKYFGDSTVKLYGEYTLQASLIELFLRGLVEQHIQRNHIKKKDIKNVQEYLKHQWELDTKLNKAVSFWLVYNLNICRRHRLISKGLYLKIKKYKKYRVRHIHFAYGSLAIKENKKELQKSLNEGYKILGQLKNAIYNSYRKNLKLIVSQRKKNITVK